MASKNGHDGESLRQREKHATLGVSSARTEAGILQVFKSKTCVAHYKEVELVVVSYRADQSNHTQGR